MSALAKASSEIRWSIPIQVLEEAFKEPRTHYSHLNSLSLDERIYRKVIRDKVLEDCDIVSGQEVLVSLSGITPEYVDSITSLYTIPLDKTAGRSISAVLSVSYLPFQTGTNHFNPSVNANCDNPDTMTTGQKVFDSHASMIPVSTAYTEIVGENVVMVRNQSYSAINYFLRCRVVNDQNLNNIERASWKKFAELCVLAVKAYVYNTLRVKMGNAFLSGGQELGVFKEVVESYSDAKELYDTYLDEQWAAVANMNDTHSHLRYLKMMVNPSI